LIAEDLMFAPAMVGAGMRLSATAFERGRSALLNSAVPMAQGCRGALLCVRPRKIAWRRSDTYGNRRQAPAAAGLPPLASASIDFNDGTSAGPGRLRVGRRVKRSSRACVRRRASRRLFGRVTSQATFGPTRHLRSGAARLRAVNKISAMNHQGRILTWRS
jgi:hypothetical protein